MPGDNVAAVSLTAAGVSTFVHFVLTFACLSRPAALR